MSDEDVTLGDHLELLGAQMHQHFDWYPVAKKEFQDAIRSMGLWVLALVFTLLFLLPAVGLVFGLKFLIPGSGGPGDAAKLQMGALIDMAFYLDIATLLVPIISIFVGFGAITKERESGSLKLLLSLPNSRKDVVVGKVLGRCAVSAAAMLVAFFVTGLFFALPWGPLNPAIDVVFEPGVFLLFVLYTIGLSLVFVAIAVSLSGALSRGLYSLIANFFLYIYFTFSWNAIANWAADFLGNTLGWSGALRWHIVLFIKLLNPTQAYKTLTASMLREGPNAARSARMRMFNRPNWEQAEICTEVLNGKAVLSRGGLFTPTTIDCQAAGAGLPLYTTDAAVFVFTMLWIGVAAFVSYKTFNLADL